jgi:peptide/nickel transport system permease protein
MFEKDSRQELLVRRFRKNKIGILGLLLSGVFVFVAVFGPVLLTKDLGAVNPQNRLAPPSMAHPFGTDSLGRDVFTRVIYGARYTLIIATSVVIFSTFVGATLGLVAGYYGKITDSIISRTIDVFFAFPSILLALLIVTILGPGLSKAIIALAIAYTPIMVRVTRGSTLSIKEEEYIMAAISYGEDNLNILRRDVLPNISAPIIVQASITYAFSILSEAGLSYLGLSAQPPTPTWGIMISDGQNFLEIAPWVSLFPGLSIMFVVLGFSFLGIGLRDALDPKGETEVDMTKGA